VAGTTTITLPSSTATLATNENFTSTGIDDNATSTAITIDSSENVGLGVTPESWENGWTALQVGGISVLYGSTAQVAGSETDLANNAYINSSGQASYIVTDEASRIRQDSGIIELQVASSGQADDPITWTTAMTINNSGNITRDGSFDSTSNDWSLSSTTLQLSRSSTGSYDQIVFYNPNGEVGTIMTSASSTSYNTSSDYRLKENVVPMTGSIDRVKALKPSRFNFITDPDTTVDGFLAHEAQEVVPEAISGEKDAMMMEEYEVTPAVKDENDNIVTEAVMGTREVPDMQGIDQAKLVPLLVGAIQEQQTLIESLQADIAILKGATI